MKSIRRFAWIMSLALWVANASAYEVWMGTHLMTHTDATNLSTWSTVAPKLEGINSNRAPHDTDPATNDDWRTIYQQFTGSRNTITEFARSQATRDPSKTDELAFPSIAQRLEEIFSFETTFGYDLTAIMFYDERGTFQGTEYLYEWTDIEIQYLRDWLDANGHSDVKLKWNVRNNSLRNQQIAAKAVVDSVEIEASTTAFLNNTNNQITFFQWFWNNPATANKPIALQIPRTLDSLNQYKGTRRVAQMLGGIIGYGDNGMRSNRLIFLPVTYNDNYPYTPETVSNGAAYTNTLTSICLSLLEQRDLFEGRLSTLPTVALADSTVRTIPPTVSAIADRLVSENTATGAIPFTIGDPDTPVAALTVTATSSNPTLVPNAGIVLGGSGANRTVTITPAPGQQGTAVITIQANDGFWNGSATFTLTVGSVLFSGATDTNIKDDNTLVDQNSATAWTGSGGTSPFVDRCTVFVFQLPNLGAIANPFKSSSLSFNYDSKTGTVPHIDLYGLGRRDSAAVLGSDYYGQTATSDPSDATRFQTNILTNTTPLGLVGTSSGGNAALLAYLNAQYASGSGIGKYVFLRLSSTVPKSGSNRATFTMSEGGAAGPPDTRPRILYATNSAPTIGGVADIFTAPNTPTAAIPFTVGDAETAAASLIVTGSSSNTTLVPNAAIALGGSGADRTVMITPAAGQSGASVITLQVDDGARIASTTFTITVLPSNSVSGTLYSDLADSAPRQVDGSGPSILASTATDATLYAGRGGTGGSVDRCVVFPFQLPDLGVTTTPFTTATLTFNLVSNNFSPLTCNLDLYGLATRAVPTVLAGDFYSETDVPDPVAGTTRLQDNLCTAATAAGLITTNAGNAALANYLNAQYAGGANAGKYVFFRLSKDTANGANTKQYLVTSADGAAAANAGSPDLTVWPRIAYNAVTGNFPPTITDIADRGIAVNTNTGAVPFTIGDNQTPPASLVLGKSSSNPALVPTANITFGGSGANRTVIITPVTNQLGSATITVTVSDGTIIVTEAFVLTVTGNGQETWRFTHFGTTADSGTAGDAFDANGDRESNFLEFTTGQDPHTGTVATTPLVLNGANLEFTYTRSLDAMADGVIYSARWSDTMAAGSWSTVGVTEQTIADDGTVQMIKATIAAGSAGRRFVRLEVMRP